MLTRSVDHPLSGPLFCGACCTIWSSYTVTNLLSSFLSCTYRVLIFLSSQDFEKQLSLIVAETVSLMYTGLVLLPWWHNTSVRVLEFSQQTNTTTLLLKKRWFFGIHIWFITYWKQFYLSKMYKFLKTTPRMAITASKVNEWHTEQQTDYLTCASTHQGN